MVVADPFLAGAVEIVVQRQPGLDDRPHVSLADLGPHGHLGNRKRPADAVKGVGTAFLVLGLLEKREQVVPAPARVAKLAPIVEVLGLATDVDQAVDGG